MEISFNFATEIRKYLWIKERIKFVKFVWGNYSIILMGL